MGKTKGNTYDNCINKGYDLYGGIATPCYNCDNCINKDYNL